MTTLVAALAAAHSNDVAPGTLGFLVVFGMAAVLFLLFRSMSKHLRKVNAAARQDQASGPPGDESGNVEATSARSGATSPGDRRDDA